MTGLFQTYRQVGLRFMSLFLFIELLPSPSARRAAWRAKGKLVCLLACMVAEPFPNCLGYDILLRPWFAPLDLSFDCRTRQILN
jgi:hypothetical protein